MTFNFFWRTSIDINRCRTITNRLKSDVWEKSLVTLLRIFRQWKIDLLLSAKIDQFIDHFYQRKTQLTGVDGFIVENINSVWTECRRKVYTEHQRETNERCLSSNDRGNTNWYRFLFFLIVDKLMVLTLLVLSPTVFVRTVIERHS